MRTRNSLCMAIVLIIALIAAPGCAKDAKVATPVKPIEQAEFTRKDVTPSQAYKMAVEDAHVFIVDVRTRPEYVLIGHPTIAYHVPIKFWTGKHTSKGYGMTMNENFAGDLKKRFNIETDTLIFMCRSGKRSCAAVNQAALKAGWSTDKVYNMTGGFEGGKVKNKDSAFNGKRMLGGWKNEGLPWTYKVDAKLGYPEVQ